MEMYFSFRIFIFFVSYVSCSQHLYKFVPEHCEIKNINTSLIRFHFKQCRKFSRTELRLSSNFTINGDVLSDNTAQIKVTGYQFRSNEYRTGPIEFMLGLCSGIKSDQFDIPNMLSNSNVECPLRKGKTYYVYNMQPNATNMPPLIPEGRWMLEVKFLYLNKYTVFTLEWYSGVEYPIRFN